MVASLVGVVDSICMIIDSLIFNEFKGVSLFSYKKQKSYWNQKSFTRVIEPKIHLYNSQFEFYKKLNYTNIET